MNITNIVAASLILAGLLSPRGAQARGLDRDTIRAEAIGLFEMTPDMLDIAAEPSTQAIFEVDIDWDAIEGLDELTFDLGREGRFTLVADFVEWTEAGALNWMGRGDDANTLVNLLVSQERVTGMVHLAGRTFQLVTVEDGEVILVAVATDRLPTENCEGLPVGVALGHGGDGAAARNAETSFTVLTVFSDAGRKDSPGKDPVGTALQSISNMNGTFFNAHIDAYAVALPVTPVSGVGSSSSSTVLDQLTSPDDGIFDEALELREMYKADLVILIHKLEGSCGRAYEINASAADAFAVVDPDCVSKYSFIHELGHLIGARHDTRVDSSTTPYLYGHGYVNKHQDFRTIMAYDDGTCPGGSCPRMPVWSDDGAPMLPYLDLGDDERRNNARVISERAAAVASFR